MKKGDDKPIRKRNYLTVERELWVLSGNECAHEGCSSRMVTESGAYVGEIAHIRGVGRSSARHDPTMTNDDLRDKSNLILLCHEHHVETDDVSRYPVERMRRMKRKHESRFRKAFAEFAAQFTDYTDAVHATHCETLTRWRELFGLTGEDFDEGYVQLEKERINTLADKLASLTIEARSAISFVVRYGITDFLQDGFTFPLSEMARRTRVSKGKIREIFYELDRLNFGHISLGSEFDGEPPEVNVFVPQENQAGGSELFKDFRSYCEETDHDLDDLIIQLRFDLLD